MQCITALNAQGAGTIGIVEKCLLASAIPNPEFCIPTSIESVRHTDFFAYQMRYQEAKKKPPICRSKTEINIVCQCFKIISFFAARTNPTIRRINNTESSGKKPMPVKQLWDRISSNPPQQQEESGQ